MGTEIETLRNMVSTTREDFKIPGLVSSEKIPLHDGVQVLIQFENGYGASVVQHRYAYADVENNTWELAVTDGTAMDFDIVYDTPITCNVLGWLDLDELKVVLGDIAALPPRTPEMTGKSAMTLALESDDDDYEYECGCHRCKGRPNG